MTKFPKEMYIRHEHDKNPEEGWWLADENLESGAEIGSTVTIGVYKLVEVRKVTGMVTYKTRKIKNAA
jgi:hypothetical protein